MSEKVAGGKCNNIRRFMTVDLADLIFSEDKERVLERLPKAQLEKFADSPDDWFVINGILILSGPCPTKEQAWQEAANAIR